MSVTIVDGPWLETTRRRLDSSTPVSRLMTTSAQAAAFHVDVPRVPSVDVLTTVSEAAHLMASRGLRQVQVRNSQGEVVGVLTASDLYRWVTDGSMYGGLNDDYGDDGHGHA